MSRVIMCRVFLLFLLFDSIFKISFAQSSVGTAYLYNFDHDTAYEVMMTRDTTIAGFNNYITIYKVFARKQNQNSKPIMNITIGNFYPDHDITLDVELKPDTYNPIILPTRHFKYDKTYGTLIIVDGKDTVPFKRIDSAQSLVLYFTNLSKRTYVFCALIGEHYTTYPDLVKFESVPIYLVHLSDTLYKKFLDEGTPERRQRTWQKEQERLRKDSLQRDSLEKLKERIDFLKRRDTMYIKASTDTSEDYTLLLREKIKEASLHFQCTKMKYNGSLLVKMDTFGLIVSATPEKPDTSSYNFKAFEDFLIEDIRGDTLSPVHRIFQNQSYSMQTQFELHVEAFNDTVDQEIKKQSDGVFFQTEIVKYKDEVLRQKLMSTLTDNGKYYFKLCYNETQGIKTYEVVNIRRGKNKLPEIVFEVH